MRYPIDAFTPAVERAGPIRREELGPVDVVDRHLDPRATRRKDTR